MTPQERINKAPVNVKIDPLNYILIERAHQDAKWGEQNHSDLYWLGVLVEEVGELAQAIISTPDCPTLIRRELVQVGAVALAWLEAMERSKVQEIP